MYGMVLVVALGSGDATTGQEQTARPMAPLEQSHQLYRIRRGGGCYGGGCWGGGCYGGGCYGGGCWGGGCYGGGCWGGGCYGGGCWGGSPYHAAPPATMPAPRRSGYFGPGETTLPGPGGNQRFDRDRMPPDGVQPDRREERNAPDRNQRTPPDAENPGTNSPNRNESPKPPEEVRAPTPATIIVTLPADATLTIDDTPTRSTAARRTFVSPPLDPGKTFHYTLKAQAMRGGEAVTDTQRIEVRAGKATRVELVLPEPVARR